MLEMETGGVKWPGRKKIFCIFSDTLVGVCKEKYFFYFIFQIFIFCVNKKENDLDILG